METFDSLATSIEEKKVVTNDSMNDYEHLYKKMVHLKWEEAAVMVDTMIDCVPLLDLNTAPLVKTRNDSIIDSDLGPVILPQSYRRLSSVLVMPHTMLVPSKEIKENRKKRDSIQEESTHEIFESTSSFFVDFQKLHAIQQMQESHTFTFDNMLEPDKSNIKRLTDLVWNLHLHLKVMYEELFPESFSKAIYDLFHDNELEDEEFALRIKAVLIKESRRTIVFLQAFTGHMMRFVQ